MKKTIFLTLFFVISLYLLKAQGLIIDHTCLDIELIPASVIDDIQSDIKWHYAHTSHGGQLTYGLEFLESSDSSLAYEVGDSYLPNVAGSLCVFDGQETDTYISPDLYWETPAGLILTQNVLDNNSTINVSQWAFCTQLEYYSSSQVNEYLSAMSGLEAANPSVTFIYMTGNAQAGGADGYNRYQNNEIIRDYCIDNDKILFDFADIDCWYGGEMNSYTYSSTEVPLQHTQYDGDIYGHTTQASCENKGRAVWWMMARLTGWEPAPPTGYSLSHSSFNFGQVQILETTSSTFTITNVDTVPVDIDSVICTDDGYSISYPGSRLAGFTLSVGESQEVEITFSPTEVQMYPGTVTINCTEFGNSTVTLSGESIDTPIGCFHVSGDVSGIWNHSNICVDADISVSEENSLQIIPVSGGTNIIFSGHYQFSISGQLLAEGTESDNINFLADNPTTGWKGLRFYNLSTDSSLVSYCNIQNGNATGSGYDGYGGGIFLTYSSELRIEHCTIENNSAIDGAGIYIEGSMPVMKNLKVRNNTASNNGGGIFCNYSSLTISYCEITNNTANEGASIYYFGDDVGSSNLVNCTLSENNASVNGGAIFCNDWANPILSNCILWNNLPNEICINNGSVSATYSDIEGGWTGIGNINSDPLFVDPANYDFQLSYGSLCIDSGNPTSPLDSDGTRNDMGAIFLDQSIISAPTNVLISYSPTTVSISWDAVPGALSYSVYSSESPFDSYSLKQSGIIGLSWSENPTEIQKYYYVTAVK
ncbi:MAG: hypothetical protein K8S23_17245 [Candidatus Cloacimonetes bacterium]|nr:hypothetical protein [Candidatus Cloacimonadota bacterium]